MNRRVKIVTKILNANDKLAAKLRTKFNEANVFVVNIMASPGAGKTSLILETIQRLKEKHRPAVIEGDVVEIDVKKIRTFGIPVVLANTGGACHLDAVMMEKAVNKLSLDQIDILIIENVGNLICPANFLVGSHKNVVIASIPEGDDKPYKYPGMFKGANAILLNKIDYLISQDFRIDYFKKGIKLLNPNCKLLPVSCRTGVGLDKWISWLVNERQIFIDSRFVS